MRKQFDYRYLINHKHDLLSLGGGGSGPIWNKSKEYAEAGAVNGGAIGGLTGEIATTVVVVSDFARIYPLIPMYPIFALGRADDWQLAYGPVECIKAGRDFGALAGAAVGAVVGGTVGAAVGTTDCLRRSGGSRSGGPARRF